MTVTLLSVTVGLSFDNKEMSMANAKLVGGGGIVQYSGVASRLTKEDFWDELTKDEQRTVLTETEGILDELEKVRQLRMTVARRGLRVQAVLAPKGAYGKYLRTLEHYWRTVYRWTSQLKQLNLPEPVLDAAEERGIDLARSVYAEPVQSMPQPKVDKESIQKYLDKLEQSRVRLFTARREEGVGHLAPVEAERRAYKVVMAQWRGIQNRRAEWAKRLLGRLMHSMGLPAQRIEPEPPPETFLAKRSGRPSKTG